MMKNSKGGTGNPQSPRLTITPPSASSPIQNSPSQNIGSEKIAEKGHRVVLTVTTAIACSKHVDDHGKVLDDLAKRNKRTLEAPKPQQFFHCDYGIAPGYERTTADIVSYGVAAKVFTETDSRVIKTWEDGPRTWVAWVHSHEMFITEENIMDLYHHTLEFKLCDSKDKVSAKARFDRPKAFRIPSTKDGNPGKGVAAVVAKQSRSWTNLQPRDSHSKVLANSETPISDKLTPDETPPTPRLPSARVRSSIGRLAGLHVSDDEKKRINELRQQQSKLMKQLNKKRVDSTDAESPQLKDPVAGMKRHSADSHRPRSICVPIKLELLFSDLKEVTARLLHPTTNIEDMFVSVSVGGKLMPESLERKLNPLVITIKSVKDLPETPLPRSRLSNLCQPVHCAYKFIDEPWHKTAKRPHDKDVHFEDIHVILAGKVDPGKLFEFLHCDGLCFEIHDRDRKLPDAVKPALIFGDDSDDKKIANVGLVTSKRTTHNAFHDRHRVYDPFGVTKISLSELQENLNLNFNVVVNPCPLPDLLHSANNVELGARLVGVAGAVDRPENPPLPAGDYLNAGTVLKVKVALKYPLTWNPTPTVEAPLNTEVCHFGRVIYHFNYENKKLLQRLEQFVTEVNTKALRLDQFDKHVVEAALSTYKLSAQQRVSTSLDVLTGFHVIDGEFHLIILEGLKNEGIEKLQTEIGHAPSDDGGFVNMLWDSSVSFKSRLYAELDISLCSIRLHQPLGVILEQPLLYVRDLVPRLCFQCLIRLKEITGVNRLRDVCRNSIFPTHEMVISMSREFGIPITHSDYEEHHRQAVQEENKSDDEFVLKESSSRWTPIDNTNHDFDKYVTERSSDHRQQPDYVLSNIVAVQEAGRRKRPQKPMVYTDTLQPPHNYSTQTLNSTELSKQALRRMLYEHDKDGRYAYNPFYNSAIVPPVDEDEYYQEEDDFLKQGWRTQSGFIFPGVKSSLMSNVHPQHPDGARIDELKLKWRENTLHGHVLKPTLKREIWNWNSRHQDMNLYSKPNKEFSTAPHSIHLSGEKREMELEKSRRRAEEEWKSKIVVDKTRMKFHRVACNTEQTNASNQIDKLQNILKDEPNKLSLRFNPATKIPPLSVVSYPGVDKDVREHGEKIPVQVSKEETKNVGLQPGPYTEYGWKIDKNTIPIKDPEHLKFSQENGSDFTTFLEDEEYRWKKSILPLSEKDKENELFQIISHPQAPKKHVKIRTPEKPVPSYKDTRSEYSLRYLKNKEARKRPPILPRHQFHGLSHLIGPVQNDASVELVGTQEEVDNLAKLYKERMQTEKINDETQAMDDDVQIIKNGNRSVAVTSLA